MNKGDRQRQITEEWNKTHSFKCAKCNHPWTSYKDIPIICPKCKTKRWKGDETKEK